MEKEKPRLARLAAILTQLQSKRVITASEMAEKHGVSIRTIYRDIKTLELSGVPIVTEEGIGYSLMEGYSLPPVMFTEEEANALITAEQFINLNKDKSFAEGYKSAMIKIKSVLKFSSKSKADLLSNRIHVRKSGELEKSSDYLLDIQIALTNFQIIEIEYFSLENKESKRSIEPFALYHTNENWILIAFCLSKKDFRAFRLDRIQNMKLLQQKFKPHKMTLEEYFEKCREKYSFSNTPDIPLTPAGFKFASNQKNKKMKDVTLESFNIVGISIRTTNENNQSAKDIGELWGKFVSEGISQNIPNKVDETIFCAYTNYESDHLKPYTTVLGCKVKSLDEIPEGMTSLEIKGANYKKVITKGDLMKGVIYDSWTKIWDANLDRAYQTDFEVYGEKAQNPKDAEIEIFVGVK